MDNHILVVEDDAAIREGVRILLEGEGYIVQEAEDGYQCLKKVSDDIDLVILDIMMPGISGIKTCEEIRKISHVPVLFLTAKSQESDKLLGLMAGGDDYLVKPFSYAELLARVKALLRRYHVYSQTLQGEKTKVLKSALGKTLVNKATVNGSGIHPGQAEVSVKVPKTEKTPTSTNGSGSQTTTVKTGDDFNAIPYVAGIALGAVAGVVIYLKRRKLKK